MKDLYLEVTFRRGRPLAAYLYFPRLTGQKSFRTQRVEPGMVIDFDRENRPMGIEITAPSAITLTAINRVLRDLGIATLKRADIAPLIAA